MGCKDKQKDTTLIGDFEIVEDEKIVAALRLIQKKCKEQRECCECIFYNDMSCYKCSLVGRDTAPADWAIEYKTVKTVIL